MYNDQTCRKAVQCLRACVPFLRAFRARLAEELPPSNGEPGMVVSAGVFDLAETLKEVDDLIRSIEDLLADEAQGGLVDTRVDRWLRIAKRVYVILDLLDKLLS